MAYNTFHYFENYMKWPLVFKGKESAAMQELQEAQVRSLGQEDPWRRVSQSTPVALPGSIPWTEDPDGLLSIGSQLDITDPLSMHATT